MQRWLKGNEVWFLVSLEQFEEIEMGASGDQLSTLLEEFRDLFEQPSALIERSGTLLPVGFIKMGDVRQQNCAKLPQT